MESKPLTRREMEELLPDFIFGRITENDRIMFESSLPLFPDLQKEIKDVSSVFSAADLMSLDSVMADASQSISVRVNQRLANKKKSIFPSFRQSFARFAMPIAAIVAVGFWGYETNFWGMYDNSLPTTELISDKDFQSLFYTTSGQLENTTIFSVDNIVLPSQFDVVISELENTVDINEALDNWIMDEYNFLESDINSMLEYNIDNIIIDEEDFQNIYGES